MTSPQSPKAINSLTIMDYVLEACRRRRVNHIFGVPGDFTLKVCADIEQSSIEFIVCRNELNAGYAAEAYARVTGLGVVTATYGVGCYSALNALALANAENTPLLMLTGSPGVAERINDPELHHKSGPFENQAETFRLHTISSTVITSPLTAFSEIDRVLNDITLQKRPGYIEIPRDMVDVVPATEYRPQSIDPKTDETTLKMVMEQSAHRIAGAKHPVVVAGVEIHRFGLQDELLRLIEATGVPLATTVLGKSVIRETHPLFMGLYAGEIGDAAVSRYVEESDCPIFLGVFMSDINVGKNPKFDKSRCILARNGRIQIDGQHFYGVQLADYLPSLAKPLSTVTVNEASIPTRRGKPSRKHKVTDRISVDYVVEKLNEQLDENTVMICDIGDSLFAALDVCVPGRSTFLANAYYASMGHAIPGALGVHYAQPLARKVVLCGDGAFQMTFQEISTAIECNAPMIVIVLDNKGFETERRLFPGEWKFNDIPAWDYSKASDLFAGGSGYKVSTVKEFNAAFDKAWGDKTVSIIHVNLAANDSSRTLLRLGKELAINT